MFLTLMFVTSSHAITDTYHQTFNGIEDGTTVNGTDSWAVLTGSEDNAVAEAGETSGGSGKALKLIGNQTPVDVSRTAVYGSNSPTWVEYVVKPGLGADPRDVPSAGAGAVSFSSTGKIMAADGANWVDTGKTFSTDTWYRIILKLDFSTHRYDLYTEPVSTPKSPFVPDKEGLHFIDPALSSLGQIGFVGAYNMSSPADTRVDEVLVHYVDKLQFSTAPQTMVKGHASNLITVQLLSANSEPQTAWQDVTVELRSSTTGGQFSADKNAWLPITSVVIPEGSQQASFYYLDFAEGRPSISANEYPERGWTDATQEQKVVSEGQYFVVTAETPQVAGVPFNVRITAMDGYGEVDTTYAGPADLSIQYVLPQTGSTVLTPNEAAGFVVGVMELTVTYPDAGVIKVGVRDRDDSLKVGYSGDILFMPDSFDVSADPVQIVGKTFQVTVRALEKGGQVARNYLGPAKLQCQPVTPVANAGVFNPSSLPEGAFQGGIATFSTSFNRWGIVGLKVYDEAHPEKIGTSAPVKFVPKSISVDVKPPSATRSFFYNGESMEVSISVLDRDDLPIENFQGTVSMTATPAFEVPAQYTFTAEDKGQKKFIVPAGAAGKYKLKVDDALDDLSEESDDFEVIDATIVVSNTSSPVGATTVEIQLVDKNGRRIREENEMTLTILVSEENDNGSVFFSAAGKPLLFTKGLAKLVIGDSEAEVVNISARSKYGLKVINGKVMFGKAGSTGVGTLMLRESKD